jgi:hypothetical protein
MLNMGSGRPYFGLTGTWLTVWVTVACATDMVSSYEIDPPIRQLTCRQTLFGYDQGVFGMSTEALDGR